jgi:phage tail-like protein
MPGIQASDPLQSFNFLVEIDGISVAAFSEVSGLASETAVIEYRLGSDPRATVRKLPGLTRYANLVLKRGVSTDQTLWGWRRNIINGVVDRRNGAVILLGEERQPIMRWTFRNGWPAKWEGPALKASGNEVAIETLEIAHEGLEQEAG